MAKGQMRSNKEARKPKADKKAKGPPAGDAPKSGSGYKPFAESGKKKT